MIRLVRKYHDKGEYDVAYESGRIVMYNEKTIPKTAVRFMEDAGDVRHKDDEFCGMITEYRKGEKGMDMFDACAKAAQMMNEFGTFEILSDEMVRFALTVDGKTYTHDVYIDSLTYGAGLENASAVKKYMDASNPVFAEVCTNIAHKLWKIDPVEPFDPFA